MLSAIILLFLLALKSFANPLDVYDWLGTLDTFGCVTAYALPCVVAPVFLRRSGQFRIRNGVLSIAALGILGYVLFGSVYPVPPTPMHFIPWLFISLLAASFGFSTWWEKRSVA
jgi:amino acid transporter